MIMKTILFTLVFTLNIVAFSQSDEAHCAQKITWYGIDFSHSWFINHKAFNDADNLANHLVFDWNRIVVENKNKYNLKKFFNKSEVLYQIEPVMEENIASNIKARITDNRNPAVITIDSLQKIINNYNIKNPDTEVGLVLIAVSLDKIKKRGTYFVTFFNTTTKEILITQKIDGGPHGFGMIEYWSTTYFEVLKKAAKKMGFIF